MNQAILLQISVLFIILSSMRVDKKTVNALVLYYEKLYIEGRFDDVRRVLGSINKGGRHPRVYYVMISPREDEMFEIIESGDSMRLLDGRERVYVIGLCRGRDKATGLIARLVSERSDDVYSLKSYWQERSYLPLERLSL